LTIAVRTPHVDRAARSLRSHDAVIHVYDDAGNVIETHEQGDFKKPSVFLSRWPLTYFNVAA
jgi:hypothetical protein